MPLAQHTATRSNLHVNACCWRSNTVAYRTVPRIVNVGGLTLMTTGCKRHRLISSPIFDQPEMAIFAAFLQIIKIETCYTALHMRSP